MEEEENRKERIKVERKENAKKGEGEEEEFCQEFRFKGKEKSVWYAITQF